METDEISTNLMNVPIVPQWNNNNNFVCVSTPDGGLLYVGTRSVNYVGYVKDGDNNEVQQMKIFRARQNILGVDVDPAWGIDHHGKITRHFAILAEDNSLQVWEFSKPNPLMGHKVHTPAGRYADGGVTRENVLFSYMNNSNILSLDAQDVVIYCVLSNMYHKLPCFLPSRNQKFNVLRCSPIDANVFGVGTTRGTIIIANLQSQTVVYTLRGHDAPISALSWTKITTQFPVKSAVAEQVNKKSTKVLTKTKAIDLSKDSGSSAINLDDIVTEDEVFDIYDYDYLEHEFGAPATKAVTSEDTFIGIEKPDSLNNCEQFDYVEACESLKKDINTLSNEDQPNTNDCGITLEECQEAAAKQDTQSSICNEDENENEENEESFSEKSAHTASDDSLQFIEGVDKSPHQQILHKAEVHSIENEEKPVEELEIVEKPLIAEESKETEVVLLASASVDGHIWVWNTNTGRAHDSFQVRSGNHHKPGKNTNIRASWSGERNLLINNKHGDVALWILDECAQLGEQVFKFKEHREFLMQEAIVEFAISKEKNTIWCISAKREIYCKDLDNGRVLARYCCLPTNIAAMSECNYNLNQ